MKMMTKSLSVVWLILFASIVTFQISGCISDSDTEKPNVIIIMTDDDEYSGISPFGGEVHTPHLNELASNGVILSNMYNNSRCSPTRASVLTGMYPHRVGVGDLCRVKYETKYACYKGYLDTLHTIIPEYLNQSDYSSFMVGKWHLGGVKSNKSYLTPIERGFEKFYGVIGGSADYFGNKDNQYVDGSNMAKTSHLDDFYATDMFTDKSIEFIKDQNESPFFLYLSYTSPHQPIAAKEKDISQYRQIYTAENLETVAQNRHANLVASGIVNEDWPFEIKSNRKTVKYDSISLESLAIKAAMIDNVDQNVGKLITYLKSSNLLENTIIIYLSDNGGDGNSLSSMFNAPHEGSKTSLFEGGIKT